MPSLTAVVLGASGLIGSLLVQQLLADRAFSKVTILVRKKLQLSHPKLQQAVVDFNDLAKFGSELGQGDCIFCCIGTTQAKVKGDKVAYRKIDFDIPVHAAQLGKNAGFTKYLLVSSVGANAVSGSFYLSLKGAVEKEINAMQFGSFHTFRPGILYGDRKEFRLGEKIGKAIMKVASVFLFGSLQKYRGIEALNVARAMCSAAKSDQTGMIVHYYADMMKNTAG